MHQTITSGCPEPSYSYFKKGGWRHFHWILEQNNIQSNQSEIVSEVLYQPKCANNDDIWNILLTLTLQKYLILIFVSSPLPPLYLASTCIPSVYGVCTCIFIGHRHSFNILHAGIGTFDLLLVKSLGYDLRPIRPNNFSFKDLMKNLQPPFLKQP